MESMEAASMDSITAATTTAERSTAGTSATAALDDGNGTRGSNPRRSGGEEISVLHVARDEVNVREYSW